ncbi:uncharacterized protein [Littorina saxatilis]|uniref:Uncharacterized protein n=1 Tax=Littorina saxatilis TaxID=31220 RepID=A0AAN9AK92_9CAEN
MATTFLLLAVTVLVTLGCSAGHEGDACSTGDDCELHECCLEPGTCRPMGGVAASCTTKQPYAWRKPTEMVKGFPLCPCRPGNFCGPLSSGSTDGMCTFGK